jgi:hypothetical protein
LLEQAQIDDLLARVSLFDVATRLGATLNKRGVGTCPICGGGKSAQRFAIGEERRGAKRFVGKATGSRWVCAVCSDGGDAIALVQRVLGFGFREAVEWLGGAQAVDPEVATKREAERAAKQAQRDRDAAFYRERERARLYGLWHGAARLPGSPIEAYLRGRGVDFLDDLERCLRYAPDLAYYEGEIEDERGRMAPREVYRGPAMLAPFVDGTLVFRGLHMTWIDPARPGDKAAIFDPDTGEALTAKKMRGSKAGMFIPLSRGGDPTRLRAGEGIETTLSARGFLRDGATYRAGGDLGNLGGPAIETIAHSTLKTPRGRPQRIPGPEPDMSEPGMPVPDQADEILWLKDGDSDPELTDAAMARAVTRNARPGRLQRIVAAPDGLDWNDVARGKAA